MTIRHAILSSLLVLSPVAMGATDGDLGTESTGETDVLVNIPDLVKVAVEGDIDLGQHNPGDNADGSTGLCIYRNGSSSVNLTLTSDNEDAGAFQMAGNSSGATLPYTVDIGGDDTVNDFQSSSTEGLSNADSGDSDCGGGHPHSLDVEASSADLDAAPADDYEDTITVLVEPT